MIYYFNNVYNGGQESEKKVERMKDRDKKITK